MRRLLLLSLFGAVAAGQGVEDWIEIAVDARTAPDQRNEVIKKILAAQSKEAFDRLAEKGLDPTRDPEVVNAVVGALFKVEDYGPYLERICRLLLVEQLQSKVLWRIQSAWESERGGMPLLKGYVAIARDTNDPRTREAAIIALGKIPRRAAADTIVEVGLASKDEQVRNAARAYAARLLGIATLKEAKDFLDARKLDSFQDLVDRRLDQLIKKEKENEEYRRAFLERASLADALDELEKGGPYRVYAARRLLKLAEQNGIQDPGEFARRVYEGVAAETQRDPPDPNVVVPLLGALQRYPNDLMKIKKPDEVRETIARLAKLPGTGPEQRDLGLAAVRFLGVIDDDGRALYAFAESFPSVDVKKEAIQQLGQLAQRYPNRGSYVSIKLASLLAAAEKEPAVRAQILNLLTQPYITVASEPVDVVKVVRGFLEKGANPELTDAELRDSAIALGRRRTPEAKDALLSLARTHEKPQVRRFAVEEGLVPWARADETIHAALIDLVVSTEQPQSLEIRKAVIEALGKRGGRVSATTLRSLEQNKALDPDLLPVVKEAKLVLLERLANGKGAAADSPDQKPMDLEVAAHLLEEEASGADPKQPERLERLADLAGQVVKACVAAKVPAGTARYRYASLYALLPAEKVKEAELLKRYGDAASNAVNDKLAAPLRETLLRDYRALLLRDPSDGERLKKGMDCSVELARLVAEGKDKEKTARCWLDAAEVALKVNDGPSARGFLDEATASGGLVGDLVAREQELRGRVDRLPKGQG